MPQLTISIVNHINRDLLDRCLASIFENTKKITFEVIVVDNRSEDGSVEMVREKYPDVTLLENDKRMGFSANHNRALRRMKGKYVVLLNDDTEVGPGCFDRMVEYLETNPDVGALGPRILNSDGSLQQSVFRLPSLSLLFFNSIFFGAIFKNTIYFGGYKNWPHDREADVPFVGGACIMFPAGLMREAGMMDEEYFLYSEDSDICKRIHDTGHRVVFLPDVEILHHGGGSLKQESAASVHHRLSSTNRYFRKHYGAWSVPLVSLFNITGAINRIVVFGLLKMIKGQNSAAASKYNYFRQVLSWYFKKK